MFILLCMMLQNKKRRVHDSEKASTLSRLYYWKAHKPVRFICFVAAMFYLFHNGISIEQHESTFAIHPLRKIQ